MACTQRLGRRLEEVAWSVFLIMTGALWLAPDTWAPAGSWLAGLGLILLGLCAVTLLLIGLGATLALRALARNDKPGTVTDPAGGR